MTASASHRQRSAWKSTLLYASMLCGAVWVILAIERLGTSLWPLANTHPIAPTSAAHTGIDAFLQVLISLAAIVSGAQVLSYLFARIGQPRVIGEVIAGLALGPSFLGAISPSAMHFVVPSSIGPVLSAMAQLAVILYMFLVGLEFDTELLKRRVQASIAISHASIVLPFVLGSGLALLLYPRMAGEGAPFAAFALFCGVAMSITAFPILVRILSDRGMTATSIGSMAIACAAVDDVTAWCLLAFVVSFVKASGASGLITAGLALAYTLVMIGLARPLMGRLARSDAERTTLPRGHLAAVFLALLLSSLTTELIGIHAIFGAFLLGAIIPGGSALAKTMTRRIEDLVVVLLLPIFFAYTGTRVQIGSLEGLRDWSLCALIIGAACLGKLAGCALAARFNGLGWRDSLALGALMNTRGLVELIVLNVGLDLGVISPTLFTMFVLMALVTTMMTTPLLQLFLRTSPATSPPVADCAEADLMLSEAAEELVGRQS